MPFFIRSGVKKTKKSKGKSKLSKTKEKVDASEEKTKSTTRKRKMADEEIESDSDDGDKDAASESLGSSDEEHETTQEKKIRLTKMYLAQLEDEEANKEEDEELRRDAISHRLKQDQLELAGNLYKEVADKLIPPEESDIRVLRGHNLSLTCTVISSDSKYIYSASKDCSIIKWSVETGRKVHTIAGGKKRKDDSQIKHSSHILCLAVSTDGKFLASGDREKLIHIWNPANMQFIKTFRGHQGAVSGLSFRKGSHQLFSTSHDRSVKVWNLDEMAYVETLFGHHDCITAIDSLSRDRAITAGGRDRTIRVWKIIEESQLVFNGEMGCGSIDCVALINESSFVTGSENNSLSLWHVSKKKPLVTKRQAHMTEGVEEPQENWISAVAALQSTDLVVSGSRDGCIRFWKCGPKLFSISCIASLPMKGFVNSLQFSADGSFLVAGVGQEPKLGRWWKNKQAKNSIVIVPIKKKS